MGIVKIINIIERLEALDRDLDELRDLKHRLSKGRAYTDDMIIAFDRQINLLVSERVKLMELKVENPPEYLVTREWKEKESQIADSMEKELKSPEGTGPVLSQDQVDSVVSFAKTQNRKRKQPKVLIGRKKNTISKHQDEDNEQDAAIPRMKKSQSADEETFYKTPKSGTKSGETDDELKPYKF